ncbi:MAG: hypothetical protein IPK64_21670 [bacterium]|nr:hypothetical protein [bacterium]
MKLERLIGWLERDAPSRTPDDLLLVCRWVCREWVRCLDDARAGHRGVRRRLRLGVGRFREPAARRLLAAWAERCRDAEAALARAGATAAALLGGWPADAAALSALLNVPRARVEAVWAAVALPGARRHRRRWPHRAGVRE